MTIKAMVLMVRFAVVRTMQVAFVGTGGIIRTARNPTLAANVADGSVAAADAKASRAMMLPTADRAIANGGLAAQAIGILRYIDLASYIG